MLTLLHIIESLADYGGTPRKLLYLTKYLDAALCRQVFLCYLPSPLKNQFEQNGAIVECLDNSSFVNITARAISLARIYDVDAVCTHFTRPLIAGCVAAWATGLPVIHNEHCSVYYRRGFGRILARFVLPRIQTITCNSHYTRDSVRREYVLPRERMVVIHNAVEKRVCTGSRNDSRKALGLSSDELVIGHVGGMIPQRDHATLIKAFARVKADYPNSRLVMIGDGELRGELESLAAQLDITSSIIFTGYTDKVGEYLNAIDIYVNPTLDEGFGIAVVEAMLAGLPVVLSDRGAHPELIEHGVSGMLYSAGDSISLARMFCSLVEDPIGRARIGDAARVRASVKFCPQRYAEEYFSHAKKTVDMSGLKRASKRRLEK